MNNPNQVVIYGCGPSGLLAAHAVALEGLEPVILSNKVKSSIPGATYLHEPIQGVTSILPDGQIKFEKHGTRDGYAAKVYGDPTAPCSWDDWDEGSRPMWSMHDMYNRLWAEYSDAIHDVLISPHTASQIASKFRLAISSIPMRSICYNQAHQWDMVKVWIAHEAWNGCPDDTIVYNGELLIPWYRTSRIFEHEATESMRPVPWSDPSARTKQGWKPIKTDCNCHSGIERVGRYGLWQKGVLVHQAFEQTQAILETHKVAA